jgi:hypothetical protein
MVEKSEDVQATPTEEVDMSKLSTAQKKKLKAK